jgi:DNA-binding PucR family transcriptional regulator
VLYRLRRAEPLVGHPLDERRLELELALRLLTALGASTLAAR